MEYAPVSYRRTARPLVRLPSGQSVSVTVHRYVGGDGPTIYLQATQHGIELNGPATLRRLHTELIDRSLAGTVVVVPVVNPLAFDHRSYITPAAYDAHNPNLNRVWPGRDDGSLQERLAASLWPLISSADAVVDLHTGTADMLEHVRHFRGQPAATELARTFGTDYRLVDELESNADFDQGTLRAAAAHADVPAITVELENSRQVVHSAVETGLRGVRNVLAAQSVIDEPAIQPPEQIVLDRDGHTVSATESGLFELDSSVAVGDRVEAGEPLGVMYSPSTFETLETVRVDGEGIIYSLARESVVVAGERVAAVGVPL